MAAVGAGLVLYSKAQAESPAKVASAPAEPGGSPSAH